MQSRGVRRPSVCLSVRPSVCKLFLRKSLLLPQKWLDRHHTCTRWSPHGPASRVRDTDTFLISRKSLLLAGKWLDRDQTCTRWSAEEPASTMCSRSRSLQGQRSRDTGTSVMSRNVCYTVRSHVLSRHALTLWNTIILSFQYKYQAARCLNIGSLYIPLRPKSKTLV